MDAHLMVFGVGTKCGAGGRDDPIAIMMTIDSDKVTCPECLELI